MLLPSAMMWLVFGAVSAYMAKIRGKNPYLWFFLGMFFGVFGLLFLFFAPNPKQAQRKRRNSSKNDPKTIDITPVIDPTYQNKFWYYLDTENTRHGPMSFDALSRAFFEGKISGKTFVWNDALENWEPLSNFIKTKS